MALKVAQIEDLQKKALIEMLGANHFDVAREQKISLPAGLPYREQTSVLYVNHKYGIGVEVFEEECKVVVSKVQITQGGGINISPMCVPCRLWYNRPEFLKAFLQEIIEPAKANNSIQQLPEA